MDFEKAMELPSRQMIIYANEAARQRAQLAATVGLSFAGREGQAVLESMLSAHSAYTEGFYEDQFAALKSAVGK